MKRITLTSLLFLTSLPHHHKLITSYRIISQPYHTQTLAQDSEVMNALLVWCFAWSVGANIVDESRERFREYGRKAFASLVTARYG